MFNIDQQLQESDTSNIPEKDCSVGLLLRRIEALEIKEKRQNLIIKNITKSRDKLKKELQDLKKSFDKYLNDDQLQSIKGKKVRWGAKSCKKGLLVMYKVGKTFYNTIRKRYIPLPSISTCLRRVKKLKFNVGVQKLNCEIVAAKFASIPPHKRSVGLFFDEKGIVPSRLRDPSTGNYIGEPTLKPSPNILKKAKDEIILANHTLVVLLCGMMVRFKDIIGYHFTAGATDGKAMKDFIFECIIAAENIGSVLVDFIVFDQGPSNQSFLNELGASLSVDNQVYFIDHPYRPGEKLFLIPDKVHTDKNMTCAFRKHNVRVSNSLKNTYNLHSNIATFNDVKKVFNAQDKNDFKAVKKLKREVIEPNHFESMKEHISTIMHSGDVCAAIQYMDKKARDENKINTTAWFLNIIHIFHEICIDKEGWSIEKIPDYEQEVNWLHWLIDVFFPNINMIGSQIRSIAGAIMSTFVPLLI